MGEIETAYGARLGFTNFIASDGCHLRVLYSISDDPLAAEVVFDKELARAAKVVLLSADRDATGRVVGRRAQVLVPSIAPSAPLAAIMWTGAEGFHEIRSTCIGDAVILGKRYK